MPKIVCPTCGSETIRKIYETELPGKPSMYFCDYDGHCFSHPKPSQQQLNEFYAESYTNHPDWMEKNKTLAYDYWKKINKYLPDSNFNFLEIGGAYGYFSKLVQTRSKGRVFLLEPGKAAASFAREQNGIDAIDKPIEEFKSEKKFDVIFAGHVAEHIHDLDGFYEKVFALISDRGILILLTPNASCWKFSLMGRRWSWLCPGEHTLFFSRKSAANYFTKFGSIVKIRATIAARFHYPYYIKPRLEWYYGKILQCDITGRQIAKENLKTRFGRWLVKKVCLVEYCIFSCVDYISGMGDELLIVIRKD